MMILIERMSGLKSSGLRPLRVFLTFIVVSLAWIFFRAGTIQDAWYILTHLLAPGSGFIGLPNISVSSFVLNLCLIAFLLITEALQFTGKARLVERFIPHPRYRHYIRNAALALIIVLIGMFEQQTFIYFQF
jgi:alginate O-acetyltransferase complex protein AlgI